jgi:hypothetical protein
MMHSPSIPMTQPHAALKVSQVNLALFALGALINAASYESLAPVVVAFIFFAAAQLLLIMTPLGGHAEQRMFNRVFAVGFVMAGVAAFYANQLQDASQLFSDAGGFFDMATGKSSGLSLIEIQIVHEGALAIVIWETFYDFFAELGFEKGRYIGVSINVLAVALSGVIGIKILRQMFGNDDYRFRRLTLLVSACGLFWLFAGIHMRDSVVLLGITALAHGWVYFLAKPDLSWRLGQIVVWTLLALPVLGLLRGEFVLVPVAMTISAFAALIFSTKQDRRRRVVLFGLLILGGVTLAAFAMIYLQDMIAALDRSRESYAELAGNQHAADSLGIALIVNQPMPIRLVLGSIYLYVFPIPFWSGFRLESVYNVFKSANVVFFYFVLPLLAISLLRLIRHKQARSVSALFMLFLTLGFTLAIAGSSLETRHFGAFLIPVFILASIPDLRERNVRLQYKQYLFVVLSGVIVVHLAWIILKLL